MAQTVGGLIKVLKAAIAELEKFPETTPVNHCLMPDGCYSGDCEDTFTKIKVQKPEEQGEPVTIDLHY